MRENTRQHHMEGLFVLLAFGVFAMCVLLVLLTGAQSYRAQTERDQASWDWRTGPQYVAAKVRHADAAGAVFLTGDQGGGWYTVLNLGEEIDGTVYITRIYLDGGCIRELFAAEEDVFSPEAGEKVLDAEEMRFAWGEEPDQLCVQMTDVNGRTSLQVLTLRSGEEAAA